MTPEQLQTAIDSTRKAIQGQNFNGIVEMELEHLKVMLAKQKEMIDAVSSTSRNNAVKHLEDIVGQISLKPYGTVDPLSVIRILNEEIKMLKE